MKQVLFIRPDTREDGKIWWCESGDQQVGSLTGWAALEELADHPLAARVCLLLPASEMVFRHFSLPKKGLTSQSTPFSWMAEETLIGEVDDLHWTVLNKKGREVDAVAMVSGRLEQWIALFQQAGFNVIQALPDAILLPLEADGITLVSLEDSWWLRGDAFGACEADAGLAALLLQKMPENAVRCYGCLPPGVEQEEALPWQHPLVLIQPQWKRCRANMLHGAFAQSHRTSGKFRKSALVAMALLAVGLLAGPRIGMAWMLVQQENQVQNEIVQLSQHYFPSLRQQTNLKYHFGQNIKKQKKGIFLQLAELDAIKQSVPELAVNLIEYDATQEQITLNVSSQNPNAAQDFVNRANEHFEFTLQSVSTDAPYSAMVTGKYK